MPTLQKKAGSLPRRALNARQQGLGIKKPLIMTNMLTRQKPREVDRTGVHTGPSRESPWTGQETSAESGRFMSFHLAGFGQQPGQAQALAMQRRNGSREPLIHPLQGSVLAQTCPGLSLVPSPYRQKHEGPAGSHEAPKVIQ